MTTTYTLQLVPSTHKVVPIEPTEEMQIAALNENDWRHGSIRDDYVAMVKSAQPLNTPPVLRWEGDFLLCGNKTLDLIYTLGGDEKRWTTVNTFKQYASIEETRRAAEKALGFPDGLVIEEV